VSAAVEITRHGPEAIDEIEPLWLTLKNHHGACTPDLAIHDDTASWAMRREEYREWLAEDGAFLLVARGSDGNTLGYTLVRTHGPSPTWVQPRRYAIVQDIAVAADAQGCGLGRRLIDRVHDESDCDTVELAVLDANEPATRFYERLGFTPWAVTMRRTRSA
jgi:ribosomal protein S18 acetylase RimI-like enzyme